MSFTTSQKAPGGSANVRAYKASRFAPTSGMPAFPANGQAAPVNPDVTDSTVNPNNYVTVTLTTNEAYIVCFIDNNSKITGDIVVQYHPMAAIGTLIIGSGAGAPSSTVGTPAGPMLYVQTDGSAGARLWIYPSASIGWVAASSP